MTNVAHPANSISGPKRLSGRLHQAISPPMMYGSEIQTERAPSSPGSGRALFNASHIVTPAETQPAIPIAHSTVGFGALLGATSAREAGAEVEILSPLG